MDIQGVLRFFFVAHYIRCQYSSRTCWQKLSLFCRKPSFHHNFLFSGQLLTVHQKKPGELEDFQIARLKSA